MGGVKDPALKKQKMNAWSMVTRAVNDGRLIRPSVCSSCGAAGVPIEGHHSDYYKPLDVEWLCRQCHMGRHRREGMRPNTPPTSMRFSERAVELLEKLSAQKGISRAKVMHEALKNFEAVVEGWV